MRQKPRELGPLSRVSRGPLDNKIIWSYLSDSGAEYFDGASDHSELNIPAKLRCRERAYRSKCIPSGRCADGRGLSVLQSVVLTSGYLVYECLAWNRRTIESTCDLRRLSTGENLHGAGTVIRFSVDSAIDTHSIVSTTQLKSIRISERTHAAYQTRIRSTC